MSWALGWLDADIGVSKFSIDGVGVRRSSFAAAVVRAGGCWCEWHVVVDPPRLGNGLEAGDVFVDVAEVEGCPIEKVDEIGGRAYDRFGAGRFDELGFEIISKDCWTPSAVGMRVGFRFRATA